MKKNIQFISVLQLLGPIFVILGHSLNGIADSGLWWLFTKKWIYFFHMPLFFMISGYLLSHLGWNHESGYGEFVSKKFKRLLIPYLFWNGLFFIPKFLLQQFLTDHMEFSITYLLQILVTPRMNIWGHTWFLVALFLVYLLTPLWKKMFSNLTPSKIAVYGALGAGLYLIKGVTNMFCLDDLHKDLLFFWIGCTMGTVDLETLENWCRRFSVFHLIGAVISSAVFVMTEGLERFYFIPCYFILMALTTLAFRIQNQQPWIEKLAGRSFGIYIMHWPVMIFVRVLLLQILSLNSTLVVVCMILAGYIVPNLIIELLSRMKLGRFHSAARYLLGV